MKRIIYLLVLLVIYNALNAQAPQKMSFQSVVRNSSGTLVTNHSIGVKVSILQGSVSGTAVYVETQTATSNANGLVTLQIGGGTVVSGTFSSIDWSAGPYYIKSEIDPTGGTSYLVAGTTQLLSVAYALYAEKSGTPGATGPQGIQGLTGAAGTSITNTRVIGDSLYITLSTGQTLTAGYVRGATGAQGIQGLTGAIGATGAQGIQGLTGTTGAQGIQGLTGATGIQGIQGLTGATGTSITNTRVIGDSLYITLSTGQTLTAGYVRGATGAQGIQGLTGANGVQGIQGLTGATGQQGIQGLTGATGTSITNANVTGDSLYVILSTGQKLTAGYVRGSAGIAGINGNTILNGTIDPIVSQGNVGDFYLNTTTNSIYGPKTNSGWGNSTSLISSTGINNTQTLIFTSNGF